MLHIIYRDNDGFVTQRDISDPEIIHQYGHTYIRAYCHLRDDERTFRADNIIRMLRDDDGAELNPFTLQPVTPLPVMTQPVHHADAATVHPSQHKDSADRNGTHAPLPETICARRLNHDSLAEGLYSIEVRAQNRIMLMILFFIVAPVIAGALWLRSLAMPEPAPMVIRETTPETAPVAKRIPATATKAPSSPKPVSPRYTDGQTFRYRYLVITVSTREDGFEFTAPGVGTYETLPACKRAISDHLCRRLGHVFQEELMDIYFAADSNADGELGWNEIRAFQRRTVNRFTYRNNALALPPERFLAEGGGDCEDFALYTAGMLQYWGRTTLIGSMNRKSNRGMGHALCLLRVDSPPDGWHYFMLDESWGLTGHAAGCYIPIDYEYLGYFSSATGRNWVLQEINWPRNLYNRYY